MIGRDRRENSFIPALAFLFSIVALLAACSQPAMQFSGARSGPARFNGTGHEVMLQGFHWTSYDPARNGNKRWYRIIEENAGVIRSAGFDYVWFPPPSRSAAGDNSYLPTQWYVLENGYGNAEELKRAVAALRPARALCDIVINHRCGTATGGADFTDPSFGTAEENRASVVSNDDAI